MKVFITKPILVIETKVGVQKLFTSKSPSGDLSAKSLMNVSTRSEQQDDQISASLQKASSFLNPSTGLLNEQCSYNITFAHDDYDLFASSKCQTF